MKGLSKNDSFVIKALALLLMFIHHLFGDAELINNFRAFTSQGKELTVTIGAFSQICVGIFIFLSGIGMFYAKCDFVSTVKRVFRLYAKLWIVMFALCIPVMLIFGQFSFHAVEFVKNLIALNPTYSGSWWFVLLYAELIAVFFILKPILKKSKPFADVLMILGTILLSVILTVLSAKLDGMFNAVVSKLAELFIYLPNMIIGYLFVKYKIFEHLHDFLRPSDRKTFSFILGFLMIVLDFCLYLLLRSYISILYQDYLLVTVFVLAVFIIIKAAPENIMKNGFVLLGKYSVWFWLIHGVFIKYLQSAVFAPNYAVLILPWLLIMVCPFAALCEFLSNAPERIKKALNHRRP